MDIEGKDTGRIIRVPAQDVLFDLILWYIAKKIPTFLE